MKKNKLYTVNEWNQPAFMPKNRFDWGGLAAADRRANPWNYVDDEDITQQYMNSKNAFGISKADNPFSKGNIKSTAAAVGTALAPTVGSLISDGYESGAGDAIGTVGSTVGSAVGTVNPLLGAAINVGSQLVGGLTKRAFGIKTNQAALNRANNSINTLNGFVSNAGSFDAIQGPEAVATEKVYEGGWFSGSKARRKNRALQERLNNAKSFAFRSVDNNINNLAEDQMNNALANYSAYGGLLGANLQSGALGLMQQRNFLDAMDRRTDAIAKGSLQAVKPLGTLRAFGGELGTNGTDWTNGLLYIDEGGRHEDNPLEGVPMGVDEEGVPNLVEEGETVYNDYVFSDRMKVPKSLYEELGLPAIKKKGKKHDFSFAEVSKKIARESEQRPNDVISQAGLQAGLSRLAEIQEAERMKQQMRETVGLQGFAYGGKLGNLFEGRGNRSQRLNPYSFSRKWDGFRYFDPEKGEYDAGYLDFVNNINQDWVDRIMSGRYGSMDRYTARNRGVAPTIEQVRALAQDKKYSDMHKAMAAAYEDYRMEQNPLAAPASMVEEAERMGLNTSVASPELPAQEVLVFNPRTGEPVTEGAGSREDKDSQPKTYKTWMRYAPVFGAGIMSLTDALGITNRPDYSGVASIEAAANQAGYAPNVQYDPIGNYLTYNPMDIWYQQNALNAQSRATDRALLNNSSPSRMSGLLANGYNSQIASGNLYRQALEYNDAKRKEVEDFNRRTNMFNSQMGLEAAMANARYQQQARQYQLSGLAQAASLRDAIDQRVGAARAANLTNFLNGLGDIGRENFVFNQINSDKSRRYKTNKRGTSFYDEEEMCFGGKINRRK